MSEYERICEEARLRFPDEPAKQKDFIASWIGIQRRWPGRHMQRSDRAYGRGRRAKQRF